MKLDHKKNREMFEEELCWYNPYRADFRETNSYMDDEEYAECVEEWEGGLKDKRCSCDNCHYGRSEMAEIALKYMDIVEGNNDGK